MNKNIITAPQLSFFHLFVLSLHCKMFTLTVLVGFIHWYTVVFVSRSVTHFCFLALYSHINPQHSGPEPELAWACLAESVTWPQFTQACVIFSEDHTEDHKKDSYLSWKQIWLLQGLIEFYWTIHYGCIVARNEWMFNLTNWVLLLHLVSLKLDS